MIFTFHPEARNELNQAVDYYENQQQKLGLEFLKETYYTIQRIIEFPEAFSKQSENTRKCITNRFPFVVIYQIKKGEIFIAAIAHLSRKPGYWKERLSQ
ncbi:MAG: type II toxin-antitoxin system RelE/ParE family toxin [Ignavibacteriaceae bacterium]|nr:type II toxin-antitoxin system RelE/ParE family toxin [Ignavibacteriaceae bacterium]